MLRRICTAIVLVFFLAVQAMPLAADDALAPQSAFTQPPAADKEEATDQDKKGFIVMKLISSYSNGYLVPRLKEELYRLCASLGDGVSVVFFTETDDACYFSIRMAETLVFFRYSPASEPKEFASFEEMLISLLRETPPVSLSPVLDGFTNGKKQLLRSISEQIFPEIPQPFNKGEYTEILEAIEAGIEQSAPDATERFKKLLDQLARVTENLRRRLSPREFSEGDRAIIMWRLESVKKVLRAFETQKAALTNLLKQHPELRGQLLMHLNALMHEKGGRRSFAQAVKQADMAALGEEYKAEAATFEKKKLLMQEMIEFYPGETVTVETINSALNSSDKGLIKEGIACAVKAKESRLSETLRRLMADQDLDIKLKAIQAAGQIAGDQYLEYLSHYLDHIKPDVRKAAREAVMHMVARSASVESLQACKNKLKTIKIGPDEFSALVDLFNVIHERIMALDPQRERGAAKIIQVHTFGQARPNYYEMVCLSGGLAPAIELYAVHADGARLSISKQFTSDTFNPVLDIETLALVKKVIAKGFSDHAQSIVGWRPETSGEITLFPDRNLFKEALKGEYLKNRFIAFLFDWAVAAEISKRNPSFKTVDGLLDLAVADAPAMREIAVDTPDSRLETTAPQVLAGYLPNTRTILPAIFAGFPQLYAAARRSRDFPSTVRETAAAHKIALDDAGFKPQAMHFVSLFRRLSAEYPQLDASAATLERLCAECYKAAPPGSAAEKRTAFSDFIRFFGFTSSEASGAILKELVEEDPQYGLDPLNAYRRGLVKFMVQLIAAKEAVRGEIVRRAAAHEMAHLIYTSLLDARDRNMFIAYAKKKFEADPELQRLCVEAGFREVTPYGLTAGLYGADIEYFAILLENMAYAVSGAQPGAALQPTIDDLAVLNEIGLMPGWYTVPLSKGSIEAIAPAHPGRKTCDTLLRAAGVDPDSPLMRSMIFFNAAPQVSDESIENLVFNDDDLKHFNIDHASIVAEEKGAAIVRSARSPKGGSLLLLKGTGAQAPMKMFYVASAPDRYYLRSIAVCYAPDRDFKKVTKIYLFKKPPGPVKMTEGIVVAEDIYRVVFKETSDVEPAVRNMMRERLKEVFVPDPALGYNTALASLIDKLAQQVKHTDPDLTRDAMDEEFMRRNNLQKIGRSFKLGGYLFSPNVFEHQVEYFIMLYDRYRQRTAQAPQGTGGGGLEERIKEFVRSLSIRNSIPLIDLIAWHSEYLQRASQRALRQPAMAVDQLPLMLPSAMRESDVLNDALSAGRAVGSSP